MRIAGKASIDVAWTEYKLGTGQLAEASGGKFRLKALKKITGPAQGDPMRLVLLGSMADFDDTGMSVPLPVVEALDWSSWRLQSEVGWLNGLCSVREGKLEKQGPADGLALKHRPCMIQSQERERHHVALPL